MRPTRDQWAMAIAAVTALRSTCLRRSVGSVLLDKDGFILSTGFNGRAAGLLHCNEKLVQGVDIACLAKDAGVPFYPHACEGVLGLSPNERSGSLCEAIHAEQNALLRCGDVRELDVCYTTLSPCVACTKLLLNTACRRVVFQEMYPEPKAQKLWMSAGRDWVQLT